MLSIRVFKARDEEETCQRFYEEHKKLLNTYYGIAKISSSSADWMYHAGTIVIVVEDGMTNKLLGGARLQIADGINPLPIEMALSQKDPRIHNYILKGSAELCGLWNSKEIGGFGIGSNVLARIAAALSQPLGLNVLYMLCAPVTLKTAFKIGCTVFKAIGNEGVFYYPKEDFVATAMLLPDPEELKFANVEEKKLIISLRQNPTQEVIQVGPRGNLEVHYNLAVSKIDLDALYQS